MQLSMYSAAQAKGAHNLPVSARQHEPVLWRPHQKFPVLDAGWHQTRAAHVRTVWHAVTCLASLLNLVCTCQTGDCPPWGRTSAANPGILT